MVNAGVRIRPRRNRSIFRLERMNCSVLPSRQTLRVGLTTLGKRRIVGRFRLRLPCFLAHRASVFFCDLVLPDFWRLVLLDPRVIVPAVALLGHRHDRGVNDLATHRQVALLLQIALEVLE